ncbi:hypothetical protein ES705_34538 [subsurface metagenome]|nr:hypothetical protein [Clostridia bacterium]
MSIIRVKKDKNNPYLIMNKTVLEDRRLSLAAKGLCCYLLSKPDDWYIHTKDIIANCSNGRDSVYSSINELVKFNYMYKHQFRSNNGAFYSYNYLVYERPKKPTSIKTYTQPLPGKPYTVKPFTANQPLLINKKEINNKTPVTTLSNKPHITNDAKDDLIHRESREQTSLLLNELYIKNHKILFDNFDDFDIFSYADWMLTFKSRINNPTGFIIAALRGKWLDVNKYWDLPPQFKKDSD